MLSQPLEAQKDVLGYTLQERIGSGGFGEVWSAIGPGGLLKALKIVYGFHDEKRAQTELKALDRVKQLRHPFLLSLERIEIFEGQLIVVTELADNSLADVFNEYVSKGETGVPRDELIKYIRSASDALDYLASEHNLQHLDIKPENLLMVSGHVKVADFGLIKDLKNASQSLMTGMTPAYAAPELFDGRPGQKSDQYSLAIVYQEMLTGVRPFPGTTPAQLAAQHMHGKPNLRPLPKSDQAVIAKALSKDPNVRFKLCRDMADELSNKKRSIKKAIRRSPVETRLRSDTESKTMTISPQPSGRDVTAVISSDRLPFQAAEIKTLDPPECDAEKAKSRPALIVGVGNTANLVIQKIKSQLISRFGSMENIPAVRLICIDTDRKAISDLRMTQGYGAISGQEIIETPLRKPEDYRARSKSHLTWLGRRWIYNVPRSLQTEGLRPLGRLAFADHFEPICEGIHEALKQISTEEAVATTSDSLDLDPGDLNPRVFLLSSISGGIGSGMTLDLAYTIKLLMMECGLSSDSVTGLMMHSTYQRTRDPGLASANAFAFFTEMRHFVENGFPGDNSTGLPEFEDEPPFDYTYFNDLGSDLCHSEFDDRLDKVAEYVCLSTTSKCSEFFDQCRSLESDIEHFSLRTFGLSHSGPGRLSGTAVMVNRVGRGLVRRWLNGNPNVEFDPNSPVDAALQEFDLAKEPVIDRLTTRANEILDDSFQSIVDGAKEIAVSPSKGRLSNMIAYLDGALGCPPSRRDTSHVDPEVCVEMEEAVGSDADLAGGKLSNHLMGMMDGSEMNLHNLQMAVSCCISKLEMLCEDMGRSSTQFETKSAQLMQAMEEFSMEKVLAKADERARYEALFDEYCQMRFQEFVARFSRTFYRVVTKSMEVAKGMLVRCQSQVEMIASEFEGEDEMDTADADGSFSFDSMLSESVTQEIYQHISKTEIQVYESTIKERGGYLKLLNEPGVWQNQVPGQIRKSAQRVLADAYKKISLDEVISANAVEPERFAIWLNEKMLDSRPLVDDCGGATRLLIGLPSLSSKSVIPDLMEKQFSVKGCSINGTQGDFVLCLEGEDISLANVAYRLLEARPDAIELVKRIQTRNDIEWNTLDDLL